MKKEFKLNKNNKIELTKEQLKSLLDDAYWEGYRSASYTTWTYTTPNWTPYYWTAVYPSVLDATSKIVLNANEPNQTTITGTTL